MSNRPRLNLMTSVAILAGAGFILPGIASADIKLPSPYLSRSLDAVLLPIDDSVRTVFNLFADDTGVFVVSTAPGGVADNYGILPGDVISFLDGKPVSAPIDLDTFVYYWLVQGYTDYVWDIYRAGQSYTYESSITEDLWYETYDYSVISTWSSYSSESFSYEEFYSEYSSEISESYESSESYIEETASSEEYSAEMSEESSDQTSEDVTDSEETGDDSAMDDASDDSAMDDAADDGSMDDAADDSAMDDSADDGSMDDGSMDDGSDGGDDGSMDDGSDGGDDGSDGGDDSGGDDSGGDDSGGDDSGGDDSGE
jgi:hypothetical protein